MAGMSAQEVLRPAGDDLPLARPMVANFLCSRLPKENSLLSSLPAYCESELHLCQGRQGPQRMHMDVNGPSVPWIGISGRVK